MNTIQAIYENGVFRPIGPVECAEHSKVEFEPRPVLDDQKAQVRREINAIPSQSFDTEEPDLAARHNEHLP